MKRCIQAQISIHHFKRIIDGKVYNIHVTIYDSLEMMYGDLCLDTTLHSREGEFKYVRKKEDVMIGFL